MPFQSDDRFVKIDTAGQGGFSIADLYLDQNLQRKVIIKQIQDYSQVDRLLDEIQALQNAKSKHIVQIYDILFDGEEPNAIVEEFAPGPDLMGYTFQQANVNEYIKILFQLAKGLLDIHNCNIVHRDFKPNNVKFDDENILKIFDFGLAKNDIPASTVGLIGTPGFMAPELFWSPPYIDKPVDCYAFGCTAYYLAKKSPPKCARKMPPIERQADESISNYVNLQNQEIIKLIDSCLELDHTKRPTMEQLYQALKRELLYGTKKATLTVNSNIHELNQVGSGVRISRLPNQDWADIRYDGFDFVATDVQGDVFVNNSRIQSGFVLSGSAVITLGSIDLTWKRKYITFDVSHPEVVL
jgi:serine/threonine-protein kinase